jgi:hypothetical protein
MPSRVEQLGGIERDLAGKQQQMRLDRFAQCAGWR